MARREFTEELSTIRHGPRMETGLSLKIVQDQVVTSRDLPSSGTLVIGRSREADIRIDDPSVSRRHAALHLGPNPAVEELGSANGTRVGGRTLATGERAPIAPGQVFEVGSIALILQRPVPQLSKDAPPPGAVESDRPISDLPVLAEDGPMAAILRLVERIAEGDISVLLLGETGSGKDVLAELIHRRSRRAAGRLLKLNCATFSEGLLESELFGHEKGAFTSAEQPKPGLIEIADGGTVFLDEVGELPTGLQAKLLRVLEDKTVTRIGSVQSRRIDVRFIAASNRDLEAEVSAGRFRQDLFYRLNGFALVVPPLRERVSEIPILARHFTANEAAALHLPRAPEILPEVMSMLIAHRWPGNVRELRNTIARAVLLSRGDPIGREHLPVEKMTPIVAPAIARPGDAPTGKKSAAQDQLRSELDRLEKQRVLDALAEAGGNQSRAAKILGISRSTLLLRLDEYGLPRPRGKK